MVITIIKIILSVLFILAGAAKIFGVVAIKAQFTEFGLSVKIMTLVGILEILGAIGLQIPFLKKYAAIGLALLMIGAIVNHFKVMHPFSQSAPSILLFMALLTFLYLTFKK